MAHRSASGFRFLHWASIVATLGCHRIPGEVPDGLRRDWLRRDIGVVERVLAGLPIAEGDTVDAVVARLGGVGRADTDLGFGGQSTFASIAGGYSSCSFSLLSLERRIIEATVTCSAGAEGGSAMVVLRRIVKPPLVESTDGSKFTYSYAVDGGKGLLVAAVHQALGTPVVPAAPEPLMAALNVLLSGPLTLGFACGAAGSPPPGRRQTDLLVGEKRADLLRVALRGTSPVGRVYAAEGLMTLAHDGIEMVEADRDAIAKLRAMPIPLSACEGCMPTSTTAEQYLRGLPPRAAQGAQGAPDAGR